METCGGSRAYDNWTRDWGLLFPIRLQKCTEQISAQHKDTNEWYRDVVSIRQTTLQRARVCTRGVLFSYCTRVWSLQVASRPLIYDDAMYDGANRATFGLGAVLGLSWIPGLAALSLQSIAAQFRA